MTWAIDEKDYSQRRACRLVGLQPKTYRYASTRPYEKGVCPLPVTRAAARTTTVANCAAL